MTREELLDQIATYTGGRAAEEVKFGTISTGASKDIEQATKMARAMITRYGMSEDFDMVALETVTNQYLGGDASLACSAETQASIDRQVVALVKKQHEKALDLLSIFGMENMGDVKAGSLPYGAQRRLEIVRALATNPSLLLLDEPAAGMNPHETAELMENIIKIRDQFQIAILLIEHDMNLVMGICEGICVLNYGRIIAKGTAEEIQNNPVVIEAYLGKQKEAKT